MKAKKGIGSQILDAYMKKPLTMKWAIAHKLGLLNPDEEDIDNVDPQVRDKVSFEFLVRAKERGKIKELHSELCGGEID